MAAQLRGLVNLTIDQALLQRLLDVIPRALTRPEFVKANETSGSLGG
ncbi:hypothetical protein [Cryobacterium sp. M91]|nr:hypothetical protein [Cryobacterium sp. M91]